MKYKLLALDLDKTLLNSNNEISDINFNTLIKVQELGIKIVIISGRPTFGLKYTIEKLNLKKYGGYAISYNGSRITKIDENGNENIFDKRIDDNIISILKNEASKKDLTFFTYKGDTIYTNNDKNKHVIIEANINKMKIVKTTNFDSYMPINPSKCTIVDDDIENIELLEKKWKKRLNGTTNVFKSEPFFLEFVPMYVDKANTLSFLLEKLNINQKEIIAIGDGDLDYTMIQLAGIGIAMGNAKDSIKSCADFVTETNDNNGVALALQKILLSEVKPADISLEKLNQQSKQTMISSLGIEYTYISEKSIEATMPVDYRTKQPFGILHGGATLALAETLAGAGSMIICDPEDQIVGMNVNCNHISSAHQGDTVRGIATIIHKGRLSHVWNIDVYTSTDKLISSIRVTNAVIKKK